MPKPKFEIYKGHAGKFRVIESVRKVEIVARQRMSQVKLQTMLTV